MNFIPNARPSPPSSRPPLRIATPLADSPPVPAPPAPEAAEMPKTKKRARLPEETRAVGVARVAKLVAAGNPATEAVKSVAKELGVAPSTVDGWRVKAKKTKKEVAPRAAAAEEKPEPAFDGLDLILDIIELCEKAKKGLTKSQRVRLKAALNERLS